MINLVLQLNNSQLENSFKSLFGEAPRVKLSKPTQSKPNPICDRSVKPENTERVFVVKGKTSRLHKVGSSDRTGKPVKLSEDIRVKHAHDGTRELVKSIASTHIVNNLFLPNIVTLHHLTRTTSSTVQPTRRTLPSTSQECRIRQ